MKHTMIAHGKWLSPEVGFAPIADGNFLPSDPMKKFSRFTNQVNSWNNC
jgi:hypothetical protein